jgi:hypothetical protein
VRRQQEVQRGARRVVTDGTARESYKEAGGQEMNFRSHEGSLRRRREVESREA